MSLKTSFAFAFALALLAVPRVALAVEGGAEDRSTSHAVAIARGTPGRAAVRCSGTLVSANVVLTVRHCIAGVVDAAKPCDVRLDDAGAGVTDDLWVGASPWADEAAAWKKVASVRVPDANANAICGDDVALLVLRDAVAPSEGIPARPAIDEASFARAIAPRVMGLAAFGVTSADASDVGTRRSRFDIPLRCVPGRPGFACDGDRAFMSDRELTSGSGPCRGDSGGGAIASSDHGVVFGVLSRGELGAGDATCALGVYERTDAWAWLIARAVLDASSEASPAPSWAVDAFPDAPAKGEFCDGDTCGPGMICATFDERRSFVCATSCVDDAACADGEACRDGACAPAGAAPAASGSACAIGRAADASSVRVGIVAIELALLLRRRRRARRGGRLRLRGGGRRRAR